MKYGDNGDISEVTFTGSVFSNCMASATIMTQKKKHNTRDEAAELWKRYHDLLQVDAQPIEELDDTLGENFKRCRACENFRCE